MSAVSGRRGEGGGSGGGRPRDDGGRPRGDGRTRPAAHRPPPLEHRVLVTATLCLLAFGAVMVYSASSALGVLAPHGGGSGASVFLRYLLFALVGLAVMQVVARRGLALLDERTVRFLLLGSLALLLAVLVPGIGRQVNGARRWFAAGPIQFQPSELTKLCLILYLARFLADNPRRLRSLRTAIGPIAVFTAPACALIAIEPDLGTALVVSFTVMALLVAAGMPGRALAGLVVGAVALVALVILAQPYQQARLAAFLHPWAAGTRAAGGYQSVQGQIALGSGGLLGVGLGRSVQKIYYLPEAQTDFILAVVGEELGVAGILAIVSLYGMIAYAGLRTARRAASRYAKLLATGLTSLILCQGLLNIFVVLGLAPLTGVPLPFISYAPTNLWVMLAAVGLLLNIAAPQARLRLVSPSGGERAPDRDRSRRDRRPRGPRPDGRRRAAS